MKSLEVFPPIRDTIPNPYINMLGTKKYQVLPPQLSKFITGYKSLINKSEDGRNDFTDTSRTYK